MTCCTTMARTEVLMDISSPCDHIHCIKEYWSFVYCSDRKISNWCKQSFSISFKLISFKEFRVGLTFYNFMNCDVFSDEHNVSSLIRRVLVLKLLFNNVEFTVEWINGPISLILHCCRAVVWVHSWRTLHLKTALFVYKLTQSLGVYITMLLYKQLPLSRLSLCIKGHLLLVVVQEVVSKGFLIKNTTKCDWYLSAFSPKCDKNHFPLDYVSTMSRWR